MQPLGLPFRTPCDQHLHHGGRCFLPFLYRHLPETLPTMEPPTTPPAPRTPRPFAPTIPVTPIRERRLRRKYKLAGAVLLNEFRGVRVPTVERMRMPFQDNGSDDDIEDENGISPRTVPPPRPRCQSGRNAGSCAETNPLSRPVSWRPEDWNGEPLLPHDWRDDDEPMFPIEMEPPSHIMDSIEHMLYSPPPIQREAWNVIDVTMSSPAAKAKRVRPEKEQLPVSIQASFLDDDGLRSGGSTPSATSSCGNEDDWSNTTTAASSPSPALPVTPRGRDPRRFAAMLPSTPRPPYPVTPTEMPRGFHLRELHARRERQYKFLRAVRSPQSVGPVSPFMLPPSDVESRPGSRCSPFGLLMPANDGALVYTSVPEGNYVGNGGGYNRQEGEGCEVKGRIDGGE